MKARSGNKEHLRQPWLEAFRKMGTEGDACEAVGVSRYTIQSWKKKFPDFMSAYSDCRLRIKEVLQRSALVRATVGAEEPVYQHGRQVGTVRRPSDKLTMFLLESMDPETYKRHYQVNFQFMNALVAQLLTAINESIPAKCPGCSGALEIRSELVRRLENMMQETKGATNGNGNGHVAEPGPAENH